jgi:ankyrin repeat protein
LSFAFQTPLHIAAENGFAQLCELLLTRGAELKVLDVARRSPEMLARRNERYDVLSVFAEFHGTSEDDGAPLLVFKPFSGIVNLATPPEGSPMMDLDPDDFKFDFANL